MSAVQYDYGSLISMGFRFYDAQRIGALPANYTIPWRSSALLQVSPSPTPYQSSLAKLVHSNNLTTSALQPPVGLQVLLSHHPPQGSTSRRVTLSCFLCVT